MKTEMKTAKRHLMFIVVTVLLLICCVSCVTGVSFRALVPAKVNLIPYETVGIAPTETYLMKSEWMDWYVPLKGSDFPSATPDSMRRISSASKSYLSKVIADYASSKTESALVSSSYKLAGVREMRDIMSMSKYGNTTLRRELLKRNINVVVTSKITGLDLDQYVTTSYVVLGRNKDTGEVSYRYDYYLNTDAQISLYYAVIDVKNNSYLYANTVTKETSKRERIGSLSQDNRFTDRYLFANSDLYAKSIFDVLVDSAVREIQKTLTQHYESFTFNLLENSAKDKTLDQAYKLTRKGSYAQARDMFYQAWQSEDYDFAAYNTAVLEFALGRYKEALVLARSLYETRGSITALELFNDLKRIYEEQNNAIEQLNETQVYLDSKDAELIGF